ncbi:MAG: hypothetical protein COA40_04185 [Aequorivita sp.]|nr:MAG: hypothetical protein COA40_04185 [Aequorivita sp.]
MYPNPIIDFLYIKNYNLLIIKEIEIISTSGGKLKSLFTDFNKIDFKSFSAGVYYLKIQTSIGTVIKKVIKT